jgi:hypothetical protein
MATLADPITSISQAAKRSHKRHRPGRSLEEALKLVASVGALCYAAGYIIASVNSQQWAIGNLSLLNARYVGVGLCFFLLLALTLVSTHYSSHWSLSQDGKILPGFVLMKRIGSMLLYYIVLVVISLAVIAVLSTGPLWGPETFQILNQVWAIIWSQAFSFLIGWHLVLLMAGLTLSALLSRRFSFTLFGIPETFWLRGAVIVLLILAIKTYAFVIYPQINPAFGGGQILDVKLLINESKIVAAGQLLPMESDPKTGKALPWSKSVGLLDQNEKLFYLLVPNEKGAYERGIQISKELVDGVVAVQPPSQVADPSAAKE